MVAQVAEHSSEKAGVGSASLPHGTNLGDIGGRRIVAIM